MIGVILICIVYSCNICTNTSSTYKNINTPNVENYEEALSGPNASPKPSMPSNISTSITTFNTNALGLP